MGRRTDGNNGNAGAGNNAAGSSAAGDPLFDNDSGASAGNTGGGSSAGASGANAGGNTDPAPGAGAAAINIPQNWKDILPQEYKDAAWLKNISDIPTLVKSHAHMQKMVGADKIAVPSKNATPEEWKAVYEKLGLPAKPEEYKVEIDPKFKDKMDEDFVKGLSTKAHEAGILPHQAKKVAEWFAEENEKAFVTQQKELEAHIAAGIDGLKKEWGTAYQEKVNQAKVALKELGGEELTKYVRESGLGKNAAFIKIMAKAGELLAEDRIRDGDGNQSEGHLTPSQARAKLQEIKADIKSPYYNKDHHEHARVKAEVNRLYQMAFPVKEA